MVLEISYIKHSNMKNEIISAFAYKTGKAIEELIKSEINDIQKENTFLKHKIMEWYNITKNEKFAEHFNIEKTELKK